MDCDAAYPTSLAVGEYQCEILAGSQWLISRYQAARRLRPFLRRERSTARPPRVRMRRRNPWRRLRRRTLGW